MAALLEMTLVSFLKIKGYHKLCGILSNLLVVSVLSSLKYQRGERVASAPFLILTLSTKYILRLFNRPASPPVMKWATDQYW